MYEWLLWTGVITFGLMLVYSIFRFDFIIVLVHARHRPRRDGLGPLRPVPAVASAAYERQLAKQRYFSRERSPSPSRRSGRRPAPPPPPLSARPAPMPIEIRRFGVGHRRPDGRPGTTGIEGQVIEGARSDQVR